MNCESNDQAIKQARIELERVRDRAEALVPEYKSVIASFVSDWANKLIERAVTDKPDVTKALGKQKLGEIKTKFNGILDSFPDLSQKRLEDDSIWPHRGEIPEEIESNSTISYDLKSSANDSINEAMRDLIGEVGALLIENGFADTGSHSEWKARSGKPPRYSYGIPSYGIAHDEELGRITKQYGQILEEYVTAAKTLRESERAKEAAEAKDLWDQV